MTIELKRVDEYRWRIDPTGGMRVPGLIYASERMIRDVRKDDSSKQVANVAHLPGIVGASMAMPDVHLGYGFPIGGVAAFRPEDGVLSPGGVGYDINCGVRLMSTHVPRGELGKDLGKLAQALYDAIPSGLGRGSELRLSQSQLDDVLVRGARWTLDRGLARPADLDHIEEGGQLDGANPGAVSDRARDRGRPQLGSLGSGNHFCELGYVETVYDREAAEVMGLRRGQLTVMLHTGSRGFGYQVCHESLRTMLQAAKDHGIELPDRQLCAAPLGSAEAERYFGAMACAVNFAFANRQALTARVRDAMGGFFGEDDSELGLDLVYDVCHNIAKWETHEVDGERVKLCVHRKGATRAFGPGHPDVPERYRAIGQPVLVPGDMGRYSYVLAGTKQAERETFGSCCHGAGRRMSRTRARKEAGKRRIFDELKRAGIHVLSPSKRTVAEEIPEAYKDVADVVDVVVGAGLATKVARLKPLAVIKG
jgi:tRNA-splicing ligase RtcB (3'-phosphate/5'-hydroxy nucleic acid ligase)